ncbi:nucleophosmin [Anopheles aquasalis]|uniref:nucleophosmin n=1 Tax=Anopheles aquasalis TaxID=42839 RepID=UPI00215B5B2D|nr:nucleophosmin [Anopheles aquasalis]
MKHQQVVPDYAAMVQTSGTCLCLVFCGWVLFKLVQAVFWLPGYLEKNQGRLYQKLEPPSPTEDDSQQERKADGEGVQRSKPGGDRSMKEESENADGTIEEEQEDDEIEENSDREANDSEDSESDSKKDK